MNETNFVAMGREESLGNVVITPGAFDGDNQIAQVVLLARGLKLGQREIQFRTIVFDGSRWDKNFAVEIAKHPLEARLGAIDTDDTEMLGPNLLHAWLNDTMRLVNANDKTPTTVTARTLACHESPTSERGKRQVPIILEGG